VFRLAGTEERMVVVLGELGLAGLVASIDGMSVLSGVVILAETGDLHRFASGRAMVKHAGLNPSEHTSATIDGQTRISRVGRPALRAAAWRAVWGALRHNTVLAAKYAHLTGRDRNRLADGQARTACAAALLHWPSRRSSRHRRAGGYRLCPAFEICWCPQRRGVV
jgi:transposase